MYKKITVWIAIFTLGLFYYGGVEKASAEEYSGEFNYTCEVDSVLVNMDINMTVEPTISVPESVKAEEDIVVDNIKTEIELDLSVLGGLASAVDPLEGKVNQFNLIADDEVKNVVEGGIDIPSTAQDDDNRAKFKVDGNDTSFTAGKENVDIEVGEIKAEIHAVGQELPVVCTLDSDDNVIATVKVEEEDEGTEEDTVAPEITLNGDNPMELEVGDIYEEPGASAEDDVDGDVSDDIKITGEVNTDEAGTYEVVYTVSDEAGNEATVIREVIVVEKEEEEELTDEEKALKAVNEAESNEEMITALKDEDLGLNLQAVRNHNTYRWHKLAEAIIAKRDDRPDGKFLVGASENKEDDYEGSVQEALNQANGSLLFPGSSEEKAFNAINKADNAEAMEAALENEDLEVDIAAYSELFGYEQAEVARLLLENRPDDEEGYPLPANIQEALDDAINIVTKTEEREELENQIKELEKELEQLSKELENAQDEAAEVQEALKQAKEELENALAKAEQALEEAENATEAAAQAKKEAEEAREAAEQAKEDVEKARKEAEEAKQAAEKALAEAEQAKKDAAKALEEAQKALDNAKNNEENEDEENNENSNNDENNGNNDNNKNDDDKNGDKGDKKETTVTTVSNDKGNGNKGDKGLLPNTATNNPLYIALGAGLLLLGSATTLVARRKKLN